MLINKSRILSLRSNFGGIPEGTRVVLGVRMTHEIALQLPHLGFSDPPGDGEAVLPPADGPVCTRNAEGYEIIHKDQPMETAYRQIEWHWEEFHGPYDRVEQSKIVDVPYQRYPRTFVPPASLELTLTDHDELGPLVMIVGSFSLHFDNGGELLHATNLLLECFGECEVFTHELEVIGPERLRRVNWNVLPPGRHPWEQIEEHVREVLDQKGERERPVFRHRWRRINEFGPEFVAVGQAGFRGYLIFGFPDRNLFVLESAYYGNATYVLGADWERLSEMTKAELLEDALHQDRIVHREGWDHRIRGLLQG